MRVLIRGTIYPDVRTAACAIGVSMSTIYRAVNLNRTDTVGLGSGNGSHRRGHGYKPKPVTLCGHTFRSQGALASHIGWHRRRVSAAIAKGGIHLERLIAKLKEHI